METKIVAVSATLGTFLKLPNHPHAGKDPRCLWHMRPLTPPKMLHLAPTPTSTKNVYLPNYLLINQWMAVAPHLINLPVGTCTFHGRKQWMTKCWKKTRKASKHPSYLARFWCFFGHPKMKKMRHWFVKLGSTISTPNFREAIFLQNLWISATWW